MGEKYRHEHKYKIDSAQAAVLEMRAAGVLQPDTHADTDGTYLIKSLYFDDLDDTCLKENEDGYDLRSKFRIRYYNQRTDSMQLEKKSKENGLTKKESCPITMEQCREFMAGRIPVVTADMPEQMQSLFTQMRLRNMRPKVIVLYERKPFVSQAGNVRITFDRNICSSNDISSFLEAEQVARPILQKGESLLEVKWDELLPDYIYRQLSLESLQWTSFSKYYLCRKYNSYGGVRV